MKRLLNILMVVSIIIIFLFLFFYIYDEFIMPKKYISSNVKYEVEKDTDTCSNLQKLVIKYIQSVTNDSDSLYYFLPIICRNDEKKAIFINNIKHYETINCVQFYKINNDTYKVKYNLNSDKEEMYDIIIKIYKSRNYYRVLYDELYDLGRKVE